MSEPVVASGATKQPDGMKPRVVYSEVFQKIDLESLVWEKSKLLLDGEEFVYAGHHYDTLVWLKRKNQVECYHQSEVMSRLKCLP